MAQSPKTEEGRKSAVALAYREGQRSPTVVAKGYGQLAERIIDRAKDAGVFVHDSPELVSLLMQENKATGADFEFESWLASRKSKS